MKRLIAALALGAAIALGGCAQGVNTTVSTVKAQQTVDLLQSAHKAALRVELIYISQPPCGLSGSPPAPLCASYAVGVKMKALDDKATAALAHAQRAIDTAGSNPTVVNAAIAAAQLAVSELQTFTSSYEVRK